MNPSPFRPRSRQLLLVIGLFLLLPFLAAPPATAAANHSSGEYLVAADPTADTLHVYRTSDFKRTGSLADIHVSSHAGTLALPDGRLIVIDDEHASVEAVRIDDRGRPRIVGRAQIPGDDWAGAAWAAADPELRYVAISGESTGEGEEARTPIAVVDLKSFAVHEIAVGVQADSTGDVAETQVYLAGRPLQLVYTTGGQFRTVPLKRVLDGRTPKVTSTAPVGPSTHGPVVSRDGDAVFSTTADGFDGASLTAKKLGQTRSVAYSSTRNVVQNYRPRMAADERTVWGTAAEDTGLTPAQWADTRNDVNLIDTVAFRSRLVRIPDGIASRLALSPRFAAVSTMHPDGDALTLVDSRPESPQYGRIVGTVALPAPSAGPVADRPATGAESHFVTMDATGRTAYVTQGGDGKINVIDTRRRQIVKTLNSPTPLTTGGYLVVVKPNTRLHDLVAR